MPVQTIRVREENVVGSKDKPFKVDKCGSSLNGFGLTLDRAVNGFILQVNGVPHVFTDKAAVMVAIGMLLDSVE